MCVNGALYADKIKNIFFHKRRKKDNMPHCLPDLKLNNSSLK